MPNSNDTGSGQTSKSRILFDPLTCRFFDTRLTPVVPSTAIEISASRHAELMAAQASGAAITADSKGRPRAQLPDARDRRRQLLAAIRAEARRRILEISPIWKQINDLRHPTEAGSSRFARIDAIRAASGLIEDNLADVPADALATFPVATHLLWPEF